MQMTVEDWYGAAVDGKVPYLRGAYVDDQWCGPDQIVSLDEGELIVFDTDDGRNDRRFTARWNGEYVTLL